MSRASEVATWVELVVGVMFLLAAGVLGMAAVLLMLGGFWGALIGGAFVVAKAVISFFAGVGA